MNQYTEKVDTGYIILSGFLVVFMCLIGNSANPILSVCVLGMCLLFVNKPEYLLPAVLISSLLGDYFVAFLGIGMSRLTAISYILLSFLQCLNRRRYVKKTALIGFAAASIYCYLSAWLSITGITKPAVSMILNFAIVFFMANQPVSNKKIFVKNIKYSLWIFMFFLVFFVYSGRGVEYISFRLTIGGVNSNALGMCIAQIIIFLAASEFIDNSQKKSIINIICLISGFYLIALTGSRSAMIGAVIAILTMVLLSRKNISFLKAVFIIVGLGIAGYVGYRLLLLYSPEVLIRFTVEDVAADGGSNRVDIWKAMLQYVIPSNLIFGVGFGGNNTIVAMEPYVANALGVHNLYISLLAQTGIVGCFGFIYFWKRVFRYLFLYRRKDPFILIPVYMIVCAFFNGIGEEIFPERFLWFAAGLVFLAAFNISKGYWGIGCEE